MITTPIQTGDQIFRPCKTTSNYIHPTRIDQISIHKILELAVTAGSDIDITTSKLNESTKTIFSNGLALLYFSRCHSRGFPTLSPCP
jgi:hypothetical protein